MEILNEIIGYALAVVGVAVVFVAFAVMSVGALLR
jgi:hypothetical protein